jgi:4-hydroxybenzoate polyprenyltransferase
MAGSLATEQQPLGPAAVSLIRLVHPFPSFLVAAVTLALVPLADRNAEPALYVQLGLGMLLVQFSVGIANDVVDMEDDAVAKPWKALARGALSRRTAVLLAAACAGGGLLVTSPLPLEAWLLGAGGLLCGLAYDLRLKRTPLSWLPWSLAFPLIPAWVFTANETWSGLLWWTFPFGAGLGLALNLANQAPDVAADREAGIDGAAQRLGSERSRALALALFGVVASGAAVVLLASGEGARALLAAVDGGAAGVLAPRATRYAGRDALFGLMAAASAVLAAVFLSAV